MSRRVSLPPSSSGNRRVAGPAYLIWLSAVQAKTGKEGPCQAGCSPCSHPIDSYPPLPPSGGGGQVNAVHPHTSTWRGVFGCRSPGDDEKSTCQNVKTRADSSTSAAGLLFPLARRFGARPYVYCACVCMCMCVREEEVYPIWSGTIRRPGLVASFCYLIPRHIPRSRTHLSSRLTVSPWISPAPNVWPTWDEPQQTTGHSDSETLTLPFTSPTGGHVPFFFFSSFPTHIRLPVVRPRVFSSKSPRHPSRASCRHSVLATIKHCAWSLRPELVS